MAFCPLSLIWTQPTVLAVRGGFLYAPGWKAFLCSPTKGTMEKKKPITCGFSPLSCVLGFPDASPSAEAVGPLVRLVWWQCCCWGAGRKQCPALSVPCPSLSSWLEMNPRKRESCGHCCFVEEMEPDPAVSQQKQGPEDMSCMQGDWGSSPWSRAGSHRCPQIKVQSWMLLFNRVIQPGTKKSHLFSPISLMWWFGRGGKSDLLNSWAGITLFLWSSSP